MPATSGVVITLLLCLAAGASAQGDAPSPLTPHRVLTPAPAARSSGTALPLVFEQSDDAAVARARGYVARVTPRGAEVVVHDAGSAAARTWRWTLVGPNERATQWLGTRTGDAHYLSAGAGVRRGLHAQVVYRGIYPGIDVRYRGNEGRVEQDFLVAPGADSARIRFRVDDAGAALTKTGAIDITVAAGVSMRLDAPQAWQVNAEGKTEPVSVAFRTADDGSFAFTLGTYDATRELVIDPVLTYSVDEV